MSVIENAPVSSVSVDCGGRATVIPETGIPASSITLPEKLVATLGKDVESKSITLPTKTIVKFRNK